MRILSDRSYTPSSGPYHHSSILVGQTMGGPCWVRDRSGKWQKGPSCTDNYQLLPFIYHGLEYQSSEQAYQAHKFKVCSKSHEDIRTTLPSAGESSSSHGHRCWRAGQYKQSNRADMRPDFEAVKIQVMYEVNKAKYDQHKDIHTGLLNTGDSDIKGGASTSWEVAGIAHAWQCWNGLIHLRIREELRPADERVPGILESILYKFESYYKSAARKLDDTAPSTTSILSAENKVQHKDINGTGAPAACYTVNEMQRVETRRKLSDGSIQDQNAPWVCGMCLFVNRNCMWICEQCDTTNPTHAAVLSQLTSPLNREDATEAIRQLSGERKEGSILAILDKPLGTSSGKESCTSEIEAESRAEATII